MLWIVIFCHLLADYPLQTDAMVKAKKTLLGLLMHVSVHFLTMIVVLVALLDYELKISFSLAIGISFFHFCIDYWKNILSQKKPQWVIFTYFQDQFLHILSILLVISLWQQWDNISVDSSIQKSNIESFLYLSGFILITYVWFITEKVLSYKNSIYQQSISVTMWPRMMSRGIFYSLVLIELNFWAGIIILGGIIVVWNDLNIKTRYHIIIQDLLGSLILVALVKWIIIDLP